VIAVDPVLRIALAGLLAGVFALGARHKLAGPRAFANALRAYAVLPEALARPAAVALIGVEAVLAPTLLLPAPFGRVAATAAALVLTAYAVAIGVNLRRGRRDLDCGCDGPGGARPISGALAGRNLALALAAATLALPAGPRALGVVDWVTALAALCVLGCALAAWDALADGGSHTQRTRGVA